MCLSGRSVPREYLLRFLELDPYSEECEYVGIAARAVAKANGNRARTGSSIGIDLAACKMNCRFCSLGEEWGLVKETRVMSDDDIIGLIRDVRSKGYFQFTIRTTEFFEPDRLCELGRRIRIEVPGHYGLSVNTGELTLDDANRLFDSGFSGAYHTIRLGEGTDTPFDPEVRISTMRAISRSNLMLSCGIDPIGIEHTNKEIIDRLELFRVLGPVSVCAMRRINVRGTPFENTEEVDDTRMAQIAAVVRLAGGKRWNVAIHPIIQKALEWGANVCAVETGATPRKNIHNFVKWEICDHSAADSMFMKAGYELGQWPDFKRR